MAAGHGRLYAAIDHVLWHSEPFAHERFDLATAFTAFPHPIHMLAPTRGGMFVGTSERHYYLQGTNPREWTPQDRGAFGAPLTQPASAHADQLRSEDISGDAQLWLSHRGLIMGLEDGTMVAATQGRVVLQQGVLGSVALRRSDALNLAYTCTRY